MKILVVDDHALFRVGVRHILATAPECRIVGEATTARAALALLDAERPDVVLLDIALPGMDGVVATREIRRRAPATRILIMSAHDQTHDVLDALNAGATGYALKSEGPEALVRALRLVARGERYLAPIVASRLAAYETRRRRAEDVLAVLSEREREVFRLAAECLITREIARELCISRKTVDTHLYRIHRKLGLRTAAELVRLAASLGMVHVGRNGNRPAEQEGDGDGDAQPVQVHEVHEVHEAPPAEAALAAALELATPDGG
jgi:RNA polymerase sigma factor (sigma-70 family)